MKRLFFPSLVTAACWALSALLCIIGGDKEGGTLRFIAAGVFAILAATTEPKP